MNSRDRSLEDGPSAVIKTFPCISLAVPHSINSIVDEVSVVSRIARNAKKDLRLKGYSVISKSCNVSWKGGSNIYMDIIINAYKIIKY